MQLLWSVILTTFLIECHWFLLYWIEYSFPSKLTPSSSTLDKAYWFWAIFLRQCRFQNVLLFSPRKQTWSSGNFSSDGVPCMESAVVDKQTHNCMPRFEKEDNMNETEAFITQLCGAIIIIGMAWMKCGRTWAVWFPLSWWIHRRGLRDHCDVITS